MKSTVSIIWDYDGPIGQINSSYPYNFLEWKLLREIENVNKILDIALSRDIKMTFACTGFSAEPGTYPYHINDQIKRIFELGHELASHSWKHEWFPFLTEKQISLSLSRSKSALETCVGAQGSVTGFILPFSRPMSWYGRGALSLGDRSFGPWQKGASLGSVLRLVEKAGYSWSRVSYKPILKKVFFANNGFKLSKKPWKKYRNLCMVPSHYFGFDQKAHSLIEQISGEGGQLVISAHPAALSFGREESMENFLSFVDLISRARDQGKLEILTVADQVRRIS